MIALIQRVTSASVHVDNARIANIDTGILLLLGVEKNDTLQITRRLAERVCNYRIFEDDAGRMNVSLIDNGGSLLVVPQFTLPADTRRGNRPSFTPAAPADLGYDLFNRFLAEAAELVDNVQQGQFGADMQVQINNDGPVTFWLTQKDQ